LKVYQRIGNSAALTALYSKDATLLPQGVAEPLMGESISKYFDSAVKQRLVKLALPVAEAKMISSDSLFDAGTWTAEVPGEKGAAATPLSGTYLTVWYREGSAWRIRADTWNMMPAPEK
jgi:ketosteroid isomerase-like protein